MAGIVGVSRRNRGNVIPGVAIATALMPPLCTAGFGLANGNWPFFFGALYLFALNCVFIATATVAVVRYLHFPFVEYIDEAARRRVRLRIAVFVVVVLLPSAWLMVGVVQESLFRRRAADFVAQNLGTLPGVNIINQRVTYGDTLSVIEVFLAGGGVPPLLGEQLQSRMAASGLSRTVLRLHQPQDLQSELGRLSGELRVGIVQDLYERQAALLAEREQRIRELEATVSGLTRAAVPVEQVTREVAVQYPSVDRVAFGEVVSLRALPAVNGGPPGWASDTVPTVLVSWKDGVSAADRAREGERLAGWLRIRLSLDSLQLIPGG